jgi:DNA-binding winged helix-turn-helix (wHTH) protein
VREAFFPTSGQRYAVEPARPADDAQITAIARAHQPAGAVTLMRSWWDAMPSAFRVARDSDGSPAAFQCLCEATSVPAWLLSADPVAATWREHLRANPVPRGQQVLFLRYMLAADGGEATTPAHAALILDLKRRYLEMRPRLRRIYSLAADPEAALSQFAPLGFARLPDGAAEIGGTTYHALYNDFGPSSIDGWLTDLAAREMLIDNHALLDPDRRQLVLDGTRADLTKLEFDVLQYLYEREGRVVGRTALLRDVWGYDWSGGSNVVEVVISALRRKLGDSAGTLQTVRGAGYRFTWPGLAAACLVEGALQGPDVAGAGVAGAAHRVDLGALRGEGLARQRGDGVAVDLVALRADIRPLDHGHLGDLRARQGELHLHGAVGGARRRAGDGARLARGA